MRLKLWINQFQLEDKSDVGILRRFLAYLFDWYIGGVFISIPIQIIYQMVVKNEIILANSILVLPKSSAYLAAALSLILAFLYYVIVPFYFWKGQTLGKKIAKIKIVNNDYSDVSFKTLCIRQIVMICLVEARLIMPSTIIHEVISLMCGYNLVLIFSSLGYTVSLISAIIALNLQSRRAIHDLVSGTKVMMVDSKIIKKSKKKKK
ncbi:MAG: RDD family protein [Coprobacillus sp.]